MAKKTERGDPLGFFNIHSVAKLQKKLKGRTLWDFSTSILLQNSKKLKGAFRGEKSFFEKSRTVPKNGPFGLVRYCMLRGKPF